MGFYSRTVLIAACFGAAAPSYAQVRVITGDVEHIYGTGGQILDDDALRARNEQAERMRQIERDRQDAIRRQEELDGAQPSGGYYEQQGAEGGSYVGAFVSRRNRHANLRRSSTVGHARGAPATGR
jgi:hypothetical protein